MTRSFLSESEAAGRTIELVEEVDGSAVLILLSGDGALYLQSGCYDEDDHYLEFAYPEGINLLRYGHISPEFALKHNLVTEKEIAAYTASQKAKEAKARADRFAQYEMLKKEFGDVPIKGEFEVPVKTD